MSILYEKLISIAKKDRARFHMPGHKGKPQGTPLDGALYVDFTETADTGDLYAPTDDIIKQAERRVADYYGADECLFLTCGATQGIKAAMATYVQGGTMLIDRNTHKSVVDGCILLGITPEYICPSYDENMGITGDFECGQVESILSQNPKIRAFLVTSPTYYGKCLDIESIACVCHGHGVYLIVDSAHGGHLKSTGTPDAVMQGADAVVVSPHKTMGALTQGGYLLLRDSAFKQRARDMTAIFGTSSPSYVIMSTLDAAVDYAQNNAEKSIKIAEAAKELRCEFEKMGYVSPFLGDPHRIILNCGKINKNAYELARKIEQFGAVCEMCDGQNIVLICTMYDEKKEMEKLLNAVKQATLSTADSVCEKTKKSPFSHLPNREMSPKEAFFADKSLCNLFECVGKISAQSVYLYPPGVPFVTPGEQIDEKLLEYLAEIRYNINTQIFIVKK